MDNFCSNCGGKIEPEDRFCLSCGIESSAQSPSSELESLKEAFKKIYTQRLEDTREHIVDNIFDACRGKTIDLLKKLGVEEFEYE